MKKYRPPDFDDGEDYFKYGGVETLDVAGEKDVVVATINTETDSGTSNTVHEVPGSLVKEEDETMLVDPLDEDRRPRIRKELRDRGYHGDFRFDV